MLVSLFVRGTEFGDPPYPFVLMSFKITFLITGPFLNLIYSFNYETNLSNMGGPMTLSQTETTNILIDHILVISSI